MTSPTPFTAAGVVLKAKASWPFLVGQLGTTDSNSGFVLYDSATTELMRVRGDGMVGIGIGAPTSLLHLYRSQNAGTIMQIDNASTGTGAYTAIYLTQNGAARAMFDSVNSGNTGASGGPGAIQVWNFNDAPIVFGAGGGERVRFTGNGRVGIGTTTPAEALDVVGNINVSGNINAKYQDVAEWVPSASDLAGGTVVIVDPKSPNGVAMSMRPYDTAVAGVVSDKPGVLLGEGGSGKEKVATTGRVKVHVDASSSPIALGDLLVTGTKPGTAMKSIPVNMNGIEMHRPGTIVGKALEPLASGEGDILVLLTLQ